MDDLEKIKGTIGYVLNNNLDSLEYLMINAMTDSEHLNILKSKINEIIQNADLKREEDRQEAIDKLSAIDSYSEYLSALGTYLLDSLNYLKID